MLDKLAQLQELKQKADEIKDRLENITVEGKSGNDEVVVTANGNKKITNVNISQEILSEGDKEQIEELLTVAANRALEKAESVHQSEMMSIAGGMLGNFPGMA